MGRHHITLCPRCKVEDKAVRPNGQRCQYCRGCLSQKAKARAHLKAAAVRSLRTGFHANAASESTSILEASGYGVDRRCSRMYTDCDPVDHYHRLLYKPFRDISDVRVIKPLR